jgi:leucyl aminopeptidase
MFPFHQNKTGSIPVTCLNKTDFPHWKAKQSAFIQAYVGIEEKSLYLIPTQQGTLDFVLLLILDKTPALERLTPLAYQLPKGEYCLTEPASELELLGFALECYQYTRYKKAVREPVTLYVDPVSPELSILIKAIYEGRDLINTPAEDLQPQHLADIAARVAKEYGAACHVTKNEALQKEFPAIYAVGKAAKAAPHFVEIIYGNPIHPKLTLIGKGVTFDSGGLDLKDDSAMRWMKKDMGGAAHALMLAQVIMHLQLPVHLQLLLPCVENAISGNAYRPGDVISMRSGKTVEIDNTDAEGRLILADSITYAMQTHLKESASPRLLIDFSTLTGAARIAVGTQISAYFCNKDNLAAPLEKSAKAAEDPVWRLPLYKPYLGELKSSIADLKNSGSHYAGATTAALFLESFITDDALPWLHFDMMAFNLSARPAHPEGGEIMGLRAVMYLLQQLDWKALCA